MCKTRSRTERIFHKKVEVGRSKRQVLVKELVLMTSEYFDIDDKKSVLTSLLDDRVGYLQVYNEYPFLFSLMYCQPLVGLTGRRCFGLEHRTNRH